MAQQRYPAGAVVHAVAIVWKPGSADEAFIARVTAELRDLAESCDGVLDYRIGTDLGRRPDNADFAVTAVFADSASFDAYASNQSHLDIIAKDLIPNMDRHLAIQFVA
jgi:hypothetical protein